MNILFVGSDDDNLVCRLDRVIDMEMFFLVLMYFSFFRGEGGLGSCFVSGKYVWESDLLSFKFDYCVRFFFVKFVGIRIVVLILIEFGVVELGSVRSLVEDFDMFKVLKFVFILFSLLIRFKLFFVMFMVI